MGIFKSLESWEKEGKLMYSKSNSLPKIKILSLN